MVPNGWQRRKLSEILEKVSEPVQVVPTEKYREIGIRSHAKGIFHKEPVSGRALGSKRVFYVKPECLVVNIVFAWEQAVAKTTSAEAGMIASHRFPMFSPKDGLCDIDFITYLFKSKFGKHLLGLASPGGAGRNKTLGQSDFAKLEIHMPPPAEQERISKVLATWDNAIATVEKLIICGQNQKRFLANMLLTGESSGFGSGGARKEYRLEDVAEIIVSPVVVVQ